MGASPFIVDVEEADFARDVLARSQQILVVVDFWAPWCGPCRTLTPTLERVAQEHAGAFVLAKVNVDRAQGVAAQLGVRSIPTVLAFRDGAIRAEFVGAQPESVVRELVKRVLPTQADALAAEGEQLVEAGRGDEAEAKLSAALEMEPRHGRALFARARLLAARNELDQALDHLERILPHEAVAPEAERLAAELRLRREGGGADPEVLRKRVAAHPDDVAARIDLGQALAAAGRHEEALAELLEAVRADPGHEEGAARKAMLDLFELLGSDHPLVQRYRSELARVLFR
jgi:putative thioredoxin